MSEIINEIINEKEDNSLRPIKFDDYIGQDDIKKNVKVAISSSKKRGHQLDHIMFYGPPGLGKTTIATIIANELGSNIKIVTGTSIDKPADLAMILMNIEEGDVLFIDEIHRIPKIAEEAIYSAMEDFQLNINVVDGNAMNVIKLNLPKFTLIGATTRIGMLTKPLRDRFGMTLRMNYYSIEDLCKIIKNASIKLEIGIDDASAIEIAKRSRFTPRVSLKILKRMRDFADYLDKDIIDKEVIDECLSSMKIFEYGLDENDLKYLEILNLTNKPLAIKTLASKLNESIETIEDSIEPYLIENNFIEKTAKGRIITDKGKVFFN